uniref:Uncharacterized protein n=1 Tax=Ciona savignyi TaxID=51511 RepID=H2ZM60_CIOSA
NIFHSLRVPDEFQTRRHEIDLIVLTNYGIHYDAIKNNPSVIRYENLHSFASSFSQTYSTMLTDMVVPSLFRGTLSTNQLQQYTRIGTWDVLQLNGGKKLIGDYKGCPEIVNRKEVDQMIFVHSRNSKTGTFWAVLGYSPTTNVTMYKRGVTRWFSREVVASVTLPYNHNIGFKIAGDTTEAKISANDIDTIFFSA